MVLIKNNVAYQWTEDGETEYGDLYNVTVDEINNTKGECISIPCYHCDKTIKDVAVSYLKTRDNDTYYFCQECYQSLFK